MGLVKYMAKEMMREIGNKSREFYEFVLPPIDMEIHDDELTIIIDIPGFEKNDIKLSINRNILSIKAEKKVSEEKKVSTICNQRPNIIDKKIRLPVYIIYIKKGEEKVNSAKYSQGVLTISIPVTKRGKDISIE
jgi:HSP20 family molecular chaperone IbpA